MAEYMIYTQDMINTYIERINALRGQSTSLAIPTLDRSANKKVTLRITPNALAKIMFLVGNAQKEIAWHGTARRETNGYVVDDIFLFPQIVSAATVDTDDAEYTKWLADLPDDVFNHLRFHGHSHVNMGVSPSSVDMNHRESIIKKMGPEDFYAFAIFNKSNDISLEIYDMRDNIVYHTADVILSFFEENDSFVKEISEKVSERKPPKEKVVCANPNYTQYLPKTKKKSKKNNKRDDQLQGQLSYFDVYPYGELTYEEQEYVAGIRKNRAMSAYNKRYREEPDDDYVFRTPVVAGDEDDGYPF